MVAAEAMQYLCHRFIMQSLQLNVFDTKSCKMQHEKEFFLGCQSSRV